MAALRELVFRATRLVGSVLPVPLLLGLLYPIAFVRALIETVSRRGRRAPATLPPGRDRASFRVELRERTSAWLSTAALLWADRFTSTTWSRRIDVTELDRLRTAMATRPALITTIHFGGIFVLPSLLRAQGIPTAAVVGDKLWPLRWWRERRAQLTQIDGLPAHLRSGDARAMVRYLQPGRCLLVAVDYPLGEQIETAYDDSMLCLSTPSFRLARLTNSAVVPVIVRVDRMWRYQVRVGLPVPDEVLAAGDDAAVLAHIVNELLPIAAARPEQAMPLLIKAFQQRAGA